MIYILYIILGLLPSTVWLLFYLRKDKHPESNSMVLKIFLWGMLIGPCAIVVEVAARWLMQPMGLSDFFATISSSANNNFVFINIVIAAPIIEELLKFAVVRFKVLKDPEFDEPLDAMLYMIIAALGFAAIENLLLLLQMPLVSLDRALSLAGLRFVSATFLHALTAGLMGYWLAKAIKEPAKKIKFLAIGFSIAILCHAAYNSLIWATSNARQGSNDILFSSLAIFLLLASMAASVAYNFSILKKFHSVCRLCFPAPDQAAAQHN